MAHLEFIDVKGSCDLAYQTQNMKKGDKYKFRDQKVWTVWHFSNSFFDMNAVILLTPEKYRSNVLAFGGTASAKDLWADISQGMGNTPHQYSEALNFAKVWLGASLDIHKKSLYLTGHSLGGALASYCALSLNLHASTINPAPLVGKDKLIKNNRKSSIVNYINNGSEVISSLHGKVPGQIQPVPGYGNFVMGHKLPNTGIDGFSPTKL